MLMVSKQNRFFTLKKAKKLNASHQTMKNVHNEFDVINELKVHSTHLNKRRLKNIAQKNYLKF